MNTQRFSAACRAVPSVAPCGERCTPDSALSVGVSANLPMIYAEPKGSTPLYPLLQFLSLLLLWSGNPLSAQVLDRVDPIETSFAGSTSARSGDARLAWRNPAALTKLEKKFNIVVAFAPSVLGIEGYREGSFTGAVSFNNRFAVGLSGAGLGAGSYQEFSGGVTTAASVGRNLRLGFSLFARTASIDEYGSQIVPLLDLGAQIDVTDEVTIGASFVNTTRTTIADEEIPQRLAVGMLYAPDSTFSLSLDVLQELRRDLAFGIGISFIPVEDLTLRAGLASEPGTVGYGIGYRLGDVHVDYGGTYVDPLGFRHVFGVGVLW